MDQLKPVGSIFKQNSPIFDSLLRESHGGFFMSRKASISEFFKMINLMRNKTQKGLAVGDMNFIMRPEQRDKVTLRELKVSRP